MCACALLQGKEYTDIDAEAGVEAMLEEVGCEPVLNLAATPDEAVSIICTVVDKTILSTYW